MIRQMILLFLLLVLILKFISLEGNTFFISDGTGTTNVTFGVAVMERSPKQWFTGKVKRFKIQLVTNSVPFGENIIYLKSKKYRPLVKWFFFQKG